MGIKITKVLYHKRTIHTILMKLLRYQVRGCPRIFLEISVNGNIKFLINKSYSWVNITTSVIKIILVLAHVIYLFHTTTVYLWKQTYCQFHNSTYQILGHLLLQFTLMISHAICYMSLWLYCNTSDEHTSQAWSLLQWNGRTKFLSEIYLVASDHLCNSKNFLSLGIVLLLNMKIHLTYGL